MARKRKAARLPRMVIAAVDRRELLAFLEAMRRAPDVVRDLETLLLLKKRRIRTTPAAQEKHTGDGKAGEP
jgi:hypothetical protein